MRGEDPLLDSKALNVLKHPHMRGEDHGPDEILERLKKTPPHAWGRQDEQGCKAMEHKNTPTCVGKTLNDH